MTLFFRTLFAALAALAAVAGPAGAAETNVAVAANFTEPAKEIAAVFAAKTGHSAVLSFGSTGQFYTQIKQEAPFAVLLAADAATPKKLAAEGLALLESRELAALGRAADAVARRLHPESFRTYNVDRNVNYTNVCACRCRFCSTTCRR